MSFNWRSRISWPVLDLPFVEGIPSPEKAKAMSRWIRDNKDQYANKFVKLYHGTDPSLPIEREGLKPTSLSRRRSYQSQSGFVYLANTPDRAANFGRLGNQGRCVVYEVVVPIRHLRADLDQLNNLRAAGADYPDDARRQEYADLGSTIGESIVYGGGARFKGAIEPWQVRRMAEHEYLPEPKWPGKEALLKLWFETPPTYRSPYSLYGCPPMWETLRHGDLVLFTRPGKTQERPASFMPYVEVDGIHYQWQRGGHWVGQGCSSSFEFFEEHGASKVEVDHMNPTPAQPLPPMSADEFWNSRGKSPAHESQDAQPARERPRG